MDVERCWTVDTDRGCQASSAALGKALLVFSALNEILLGNEIRVLTYIGEDADLSHFSSLFNRAFVEDDWRKDESPRNENSMKKKYLCFDAFYETLF